MLKIGQVLDVPRQSVPFPGIGRQTRFRDEMARIIPCCLRLADLPTEATQAFGIWPKAAHR
jgi:hypothetical protein